MGGSKQGHGTIQFQSTFLREERLKYVSDGHPLLGFQSTFLREERPLPAVCDVEYDLISIHVPTRGTTLRSLWLQIPPADFNPRSYERNDALEKEEWAARFNFNPRSYERNDINIFASQYIIKISIHVPTRGTTRIFRVHKKR